MLLNLGKGMTPISRKRQQSANIIEVSGLKITLTRNGWMGIRDIGLEDPFGVDLSPSLDSVSEAAAAPVIIDGFGDLPSGSYGTRSDYDANDALWRQASWNDGDPPILNNVHYVHASGAGHTLHLKFAAPVALRCIKLYLIRSGEISYSSATFEDDQETILPAWTDGIARHINGTAEAHSWWF